MEFRFNVQLHHVVSPVRGRRPALKASCSKGASWFAGTVGCGLDAAQYVRQRLRMGVLHAREFAWAEPAKIIVFYWGGVVRLSSPLRDKECVYLDSRIIDGHRDGLRSSDPDADLFTAFPDDCSAR